MEEVGIEEREGERERERGREGGSEREREERGEKRERERASLLVWCLGEVVAVGPSGEAAILAKWSQLPLIDGLIQPCSSLLFRVNCYH